MTDRFLLGLGEVAGRPLAAADERQVAIMKIVVSSLQLWSTGEGSCQHQHCRSTMKTETDTSSFVKVSIQTSHFPFDKKSLSYWRDQRLLKKSRALDQKNPFPLFQTFHTHHNWFWFPLVCAKSYLQHNIFSITLKVFFPKLSAMHIVSNGSIFAKKKDYLSFNGDHWGGKPLLKSWLTALGKTIGGRQKRGSPRGFCRF